MSTFIVDNLEPILKEWEIFAGTMATGGLERDAEGLRNHAEAMLCAISVDLETDQTVQQQIDKSQGHGESEDISAAHSHALARLVDGFTIDQVAAEFRALRSSVIRLWMQDVVVADFVKYDDMIRFNEAIDQALAESIASYTKAVQESRNIFLGILGHDLRTPLNAILLGADVLLRTKGLDARTLKVATHIYSSVKRASKIVGDLLDFTRSQIGPGIPAKRTYVDIVPACLRVVEEARTVYPEAEITFSSPSQIQGQFDTARLEQVFANLIGNAVQHGSRSSPVTVELDSAGGKLLFQVHNAGSPIPERLIPQIFNPMGRYSTKASDEHGPYASLGLGLFIASEIVAAHDGTLGVTSNLETGTCFRMEIPLTIDGENH
nr:HAMP domain-containing sensor histidine kinase [Pseudomonas sp. dw_358]